MHRTFQFTIPTEFLLTNFANEAVIDVDYKLTFDGDNHKVQVYRVGIMTSLFFRLVNAISLEVLIKAAAEKDAENVLLSLQKHAVCS